MSQMKAMIDKLLTDASMGYVPTNFIADQILPTVGVIQKTGKLGKYGTSHLRIENSIKGGRGKYRQVETIVRSTQGYDIDDHGLEGLVTEDDYNNVELPFDAERDETMGLTTMLALEKEKVLADALSDTTVLTQNTTLSGTAQLNDYTNSDPLGKFSTARAAVYDGCGVAPDTAIMNWAVREKIKYHPQLMDYLGFKFARPGGMSDDELCTALGVKRILVGTAKYESAKENQTSALANLWGKNIVFGVMPDKAEVMQVSLGYKVNYKNRTQRRVFKWDVKNPPNSTAILVDEAYDFLLANVNAAYLIKNAIA